MKQIVASAADVSLFHVAARELGDATQWNRIAQASGLVDPMLTGLVTLTIPNRDSLAGGGVWGAYPT